MLWERHPAAKILPVSLGNRGKIPLPQEKQNPKTLYLAQRKNCVIRV